MALKSLNVLRDEMLGHIFDAQLEKLFSNYETVVLHDDVEKAIAKALEYKDRAGSPPRDLATKQAHALMEIAERPLREIGGLQAEKYEDVYCPPGSKIMPGLAEVKTADPSTHASSIYGSSYDHMLILNRAFSLSNLIERIRNHGIESLIGDKLTFKPRGIYKFDNGSKRLIRNLI